MCWQITYLIGHLVCKHPIVHGIYGFGFSLYQLFSEISDANCLMLSFHQLVAYSMCLPFDTEYIFCLLSLKTDNFT